VYNHRPFTPVPLTGVLRGKWVKYLYVEYQTLIPYEKQSAKKYYPPACNGSYIK